MSESSSGILSKIASSLRTRRSSKKLPQSQASPAPSAASPSLPPGVSYYTQTSEEREDLLNSLPDVYFDPAGDPLGYELSSVPVAVSATELEEVAEDRTTALEAVSEKLSNHILQNYGAFAAGVDEVIGTEESLVAAALRAKVSRERLAAAAAEVQRGIGVWRSTQHKHGMTEVLDLLVRLRRAAELADALEMALSEGDFCDALWLSDHLAVAAGLLGTELYLVDSFQLRARAGVESAVTQIRITVGALTTDFQPEQYQKVLQGYSLLARSTLASEYPIDPGQDVRIAFSSAPVAAAQKMLRGILVARAGLEGRAASAQSLSALVALLPSDLFRTCLARVMMVVWDLLAAHKEMESWHKREAAVAIRRAASSTGSLSSTLAAAAVANKDASESSTSTNTSTSTSGDARLDFVLESIAGGLRDSCRLLWDESSRAVSVLLSSPAAVDGEHFMQVVAWTQRLAEAGEAFCGGEAAVALHEVLHCQAGAFFRAYHESNLEALNSMLDKEMWKRLPVELPPLISGIRRASTSSNPVEQHPLAIISSEDNENGRIEDPLLNTPSSTRIMTPEGPSFDELLLRGNPWRRPRPGGGVSSSHASPTHPHARLHPLPRLGFSGASVLDEKGTAAAALDVDEDGISHSQSREIPQEGTAYEQGEEEEREVVDVEQFVANGAPNEDEESKGGSSSTIAAATNSSWRMAKWMRDYASLMKTLPGAAVSIFNGITDLLDLYCLYVYLSFGDGSLLLAAPGTSSTEEGLTPRLRTTLQHVALGSMAQHRSMLTAGSKAGSRLARALGATSSSGTPGEKDKDKTQAQGHGTASGLAHSGNLYGLVERLTAGESFIAMAQYLADAVPSLEALLPEDEAPAVGVYCERTLGAAYDLGDALMQRGCSLMLPLHWVPDAIATGPYQAAVPPEEAAPWAKQLTRQLELFGAQVAQGEEMAPGAAAMWNHATAALCAALVDGFSRVKKCTLEGRSAMSADLQALGRAVMKMHPDHHAAAETLRLADDYIKAFYVPLPELPNWAAQHPGYTTAQVLALASCIGESSGLRRKELAAALAQVDAGLKSIESS